MEYLVDTDWTIDYLRRVDRTVKRLEELRPDGIGLSVVSLAELYEGIARSKDPGTDEKALDIFLGSVEVIPLDDAACRIFGEQRARLRAAGSLIGNLDLLIGATAISKGLTLLTNNTRHFGRMQGMKIASA